MADSDSFVQEVTEEVRRDAMFAVWKKYGPWVISAILVIVIGTAARAWWLSRAVEQTRERGGAYLAAQGVEEPLASATAFKEVAATGEGDFTALAGLRAGAAFGQAGKVEEAVAEYESIAAMEGIDPRLKELAQLRIVMVRADTMDPDEMLERLQPLSAIGAPWRIPALEFEAAAHVRKSNPEGAIESLTALIEEDSAPPSAKGRAAEMIAALGGEPPETADAAPQPPQEEIKEEDSQ